MTPPDIPGFSHRRELGRGGFATVHAYFQHSTEREVAVKVLNDAGLPEQVRDMFIDEAKAMAKVGSHDNIVTVYSADQAADGRLYLVMEYYSGSDLKEASARQPLPVPRVLDVGVKIASAVETAHRAHILHRDIKPANILVNSYQKPALTDFGIAEKLVGPVKGDHVMLSVPWSPPEVVRPTGGEPGVSAEVYSLGATLWHLLSGHAPFFAPGGDNSLAAMETRILRGGPPPTGRAPRLLEVLLHRAMSVDPAARPRSAVELARQLQAVQAELGLPVTELALESEPVRLLETPREPLREAPADLTATRHRAVPHEAAPRQAGPIFEVVPYRPVVHTGPAAPRPAPPSATVLRPSPPSPPTSPPTPPRAVKWPVVLAVGGVLTLVVVGGLVLSASGDEGAVPTSSSRVADVGGDVDAGGDDTPPGKPTVTATRVDPATLRFAWTYSAAQDSDTFAWRTPDGTLSGTAEEPTADVPSPGPLCLQVKVVRADGRNAAVDWSPQGCGS
ncbi:serine/threonine-protein kinase [Saccharothrix yanglingensis]|uniref:non-specific serine/threonine protein kinase n=1 Tax=Saccharothrix yanglingensis TaxID=659496 RepID=A0ABU0X569_9PSEU|nr:serine/threonine-protein kinase [Saccharothrix yanglingensis]MDQ2587288.1 serine/threonine protein kinase [Saccharothrix yanglingensis]